MSVDYEPFLLENLKDLDYAAGYLTAALEEGEDVFLLAVRNIAKAHGGMGSLAEATNLNRENLYDMLSKEGNPRLSSLTSILDKLGFEIKFAPKLHGKDAA
jgi:probable addiction module antidote protein